jgi:hypothetical protein
LNPAVDSWFLWFVVAWKEFLRCPPCIGTEGGGIDVDGFAFLPEELFAFELFELAFESGLVEGVGLSALFGETVFPLSHLLQTSHVNPALHTSRGPTQGRPFSALH